MPDAVMIVAGETSGELYGSLLSDALRKRDPDLRIVGIGGERMKASGVELISGISSAFGLSEALSQLSAVRNAFNEAVNALDKHRPAVLILIDYPDFNLRLAKEAKIRNIRVLYYVSPQVWAWRRKRIWKIARLVDKMAAVLPFEPDIYHKTGLDCEFVGHPVMDEIGNIKADKSEMKEQLGLRSESPLIALLPGSRPNEIEKLLPVMVDTVSKCRVEFPDMQFVIPFAPNTDIDLFKSVLGHLPKEGVVVNKGRSLDVLAASDYAVIASGTASLQAAFIGVPALVVYKLFPLTYWIGKMIVKVKHISLVNILADREVVRELMQSDVNTESIVAEIKKIMLDQAVRNNMIDSFRKIRAMFEGRHASVRVAEIVYELGKLDKHK